MKKGRIPSFLGIGAMKGGTTWIWHQLAAHPQIKLPLPKEQHYFDDLLIKPQEYMKAFDFPKKFLVGEYTPGYICAPHAPALVKDFCPNVKLLVIIRNPVDRAFSHWKVARFTERPKGKIPEDISFIKAFRGNWPRQTTYQTIKNRGLYANQLELWYEYFPKRQIRLMFYDDLKQDSAHFLHGLYRWLGVEPSFLPHNYKKWRNENFSGTNPVFRKRDRQEVLDFYLPSIEKLEKLTGRNLSSWKK